MRVVLVHDWLFHMRGGEKVLEAISELFPDAPIYTLFYDSRQVSPFLKGRQLHGTILQALPGIRRYYRWLLPFLPAIVKTIKLPPSDLVISTSHCVAKAVRVPAGAVHISYCHTPMRYIWGFGEDYFKKIPFFVQPLLNWFTSCLRRWDISQNKSVDHFIANSDNVRKRIETFYHREAAVIHPPVDADYFKPVAPKENFYFIVSAFVPYKRLDIVIQAFNKLDRQLLIVGSGPMEAEYKKMRTSEKIMFLGGVPDSQLRILLSQARAVLFPTDEDFGIVPLEAQACGTPVIAFRKGGALESVKSGLFFDAQTPEAVIAAVQEFESQPRNSPETVSSLVQNFSRPNFKIKFLNFITEHSPVKTPDENQAIKALS